MCLIIGENGYLRDSDSLRINTRLQADDIATAAAVEHRLDDVHIAGRCAYWKAAWLATLVPAIVSGHMMLNPASKYSDTASSGHPMTQAASLSGTP